MELTARERLLMSLTSKQVDEMLQANQKNYYFDVATKENGLIKIEFSKQELYFIYKLLFVRDIKFLKKHNESYNNYVKQRDQQLINENKSAITKGYEIERTKE